MHLNIDNQLQPLVRSLRVTY